MQEEGQEPAAPRRTKTRRACLVMLVLAGVAAAAISLVAMRQPDGYHKKERRAAKEKMIADVTADLAKKTPPPKPDDGDWMNGKVILCTDGSWLAYRSQCHKQDPKVYDLFIAKASDGKWYYSTFHFCVGACVLASDDQPESLTQFREKYTLVEFDGKSDAALEQTWPKRP